MNLPVSFLIQSTKVLKEGNYNNDDLKIIYDFMSTLDNELLNLYNNTCTILSYNNDLELSIVIIDSLIQIFEKKEEYEKCGILLKKKNEALLIIK